MDLVQLNITDEQLKQTNELTRASVKPGHLDYAAYRQYCIMHGHANPARVSAAGSAPTTPQNSYLQANNGDRTDNLTDYRADQAFWSQDNLPEVIYFFEKPANRLERKEMREPPKKTYLIYGAILRDVPILPDHISCDVEGWRLEAWFRFDARVLLSDIMNRIRPIKRPATKSVLNMRSFRFRDDCLILGWCAAGKKYDDRKAEIETEFEAKGISPNRNSTRGVSWGLVDMSTGPDGPRIHIPDNRRITNTVDYTDVGMSTLDAPPAPTPASSGTMRAFLPACTPTKQNIHMSPALKDARISHKRVKLNKGSHTPTITNNLPVLPDNVIDTEELAGFGDNFGHNFDPHVYFALPQTHLNAAYQPATKVMYDGALITLKTPRERVEEAHKAAKLLKQWFAFGTEERKEQLAYILDPARLAGGFVDIVGYWPPVGTEHGCVEGDIVYGADTL